ncbi:MAG: amylo-alpha-1,6-glucosidase [Acetobacteraceae bacterium]
MDDQPAPWSERGAGPFYISATASLIDQRPRTLKAGDTFAVFGHAGDATAGPRSAEGIYHRDTRYLSRIEIRVNGVRPVLLSSAVSDDNAMLSCDLTNPDLGDARNGGLERGEIHIRRAKFLHSGACHERLVIRNFSEAELHVTLAIGFDADFSDVFEVRGKLRHRHGTRRPAQLAPAEARLVYDGLDRLRRATRIRFRPEPGRLTEQEALYDLALKPKVPLVITLEISCIEGQDDGPPEPGFFIAMRAARKDLRAMRRECATIETDNGVFNEAMRRATADLAMLVTKTDEGPYPYGGIPWFSTPFGRDALITGLQTLWMHPELGRGVLAYLAANQATEVDRESDAEPGKILHEVRQGEMARLGEVPFRRYYGAVDSTPLFLMLAGAYFDRTGDLATLAALWPNLEAALAWMDHYGDADGDGFVEYGTRARNGLVNQGWKDSYDSIFHADGTLARGPIAVCEVQGYVFAARMAAARIATALGKAESAALLRASAEQLREKFERIFWDDELGLYALALDGEKNLCRVRASNAGHALFAGVASRARARTIAATLFDRRFNSSWGIRTIAVGEARYNPMSYHNGSVWPHDNALIAAGLSRYGLRHEAARLLSGLFAVAQHADLRRLPELFCGFARMRNQGPTGYPLACAPQAWAAAALPGALAACLGLGFDPANGMVTLDHPMLPDFLTYLHLGNLSLGNASIDIMLHRADRNAIGMAVTARRGDIHALMVG